MQNVLSSQKAGGISKVTFVPKRLPGFVKLKDEADP